MSALDEIVTLRLSVADRAHLLRLALLEDRPIGWVARRLICERLQELDAMPPPEPRTHEPVHSIR